MTKPTKAPARSNWVGFGSPASASVGAPSTPHRSVAAFSITHLSAREATSSSAERVLCAHRRDARTERHVLVEQAAVMAVMPGALTDRPVDQQGDDGAHDRPQDARRLHGAVGEIVAEERPSD